MLFLQFKRLLQVPSLLPKLWPVKYEFLKFTVDISAKIRENSTRECLNVIHTTAERQSCLGYVAKLETLRLP